MMPIPMSGTPDIGDSLGRQDLASDCDRDRGLRAATRAWTGPPADRDRPGAGDVAALPARGHALAQPERDTGPGQRFDPAAVAHTLGRDGCAGPGARPAGWHAAGPHRPDPGQLLGARQARRGPHGPPGQTHEGLRSYRWGPFGEVTGAETLQNPERGALRR